MIPRKPSRAIRLALAESMKLADGLLIGASAANAGPGFVAAITKSTSSNAAAIASFRRSGPWFAAVLTALAVLPGASVTYVLVHSALSGRAEQIHQMYAHRLRLAATPVPVINTWLCAPAQLEICLHMARDMNGPFILAVGDFGDEWTARSLRQLRAALPVTQIAFIRGPFADLPMSSLQCYNGPSFRFLWIGPGTPPRLPTP